MYLYLGMKHDMEEGRTDANLEYVGCLFKDVIDWYKSADTKAQMIIAL